MKKRKILLIFILIFLSFGLIGCNNDTENPPIDNNGNDNGEVVIKEIRLKDGIDTLTFDLDEFRLKDLQLEIIYNDSTNDFIEVTKEMISEKHFETLLLPGPKFIDISYQGESYKVLVELTSNEILSELPSVAIYSLEEEVDGKRVFTFYSIGSGSFVSLETELVLEGLSKDVLVKKHLDGLFDYDQKENNLTIIYSFGQEVKGFNKLFSITVDEITSINYDFENSNIYKFSEETVIKDDKARFYHR